MIFFAAIFSLLSGNAHAQDSMKKYDCFYEICLNDNIKKTGDKYPKIDGNDYIRTIEVCKGKIVSIKAYAITNSINDTFSRFDKFALEARDLGWSWSSEPKHSPDVGLTYTYANKGIYGYRLWNFKLISSQNESFDDYGELSIISIHPEYYALCNKLDEHGRFDYSAIQID